jgi:hypothetical protein
MYTLTVTFIALLHGATGATAPVATAPGTMKFPTEAVCKAAGEIIYGSLAAQIDARIRATGIGVLQGAEIKCKADRESL